MGTNIFGFFGVIAAFCGFARMSNAAQSNVPFSQHGVIQNVQNYSSNPFWNPNAPYNQRMPTPVYAQGTDVKTSECQGLAAALIEQQCSMRNNCVNTRLMDIRPAMMVQMSQMPGGNYSTACAGYLDSAFEEYKKTHTVTTNVPTPFPTPTVQTAPTVNTYTNTVSTNTVQTGVLPNQRMPEWASESRARQAEIQTLQQQTGGTVGPIEPTEFPTTYADLSFTERMENERAGYEPFQGKSAYVQIEFETEEEFLERQREIQETKQQIQKSRDLLNLSTEEFCKKYPSEDMCKEHEKEKIDREAMMKKIAEALKEAKK